MNSTLPRDEQKKKKKGKFYQIHYWEITEFCSVGSDVGRYLPTADPPSNFHRNYLNLPIHYYHKNFAIL